MSEQRLIDADALKEQILDWISEQVVSKYISHDACMATREGARVAFNLLNDAPTIDAVPVVHGRWITTRTYSHDGEPYCSNCGEEAPAEYGRYTYIKSTYCPNCGSKMDKEDSH